jgi:hypothetical protein
MHAALGIGLPPRARARLFGTRKSGKPRLHRSEGSHKATGYQKLSAITAARREIAVEGFLIDFVHVQQAV